MLTFHNDPAIKQKYENRVKAHRAADDIIRGTYGDESGASGWRGCAVGCTLHSDSHDAYETELGIPKWIALTEDAIFEGMGDGYKDWPLQFLQAIPVGVDLQQVFNKWMLYLLCDEGDGVIKYATGDAKTAIEAICDLFRRAENGEIISSQQWNAAARAALAADAAADADAAAEAADAAAAAAYAAAEAADAADAAAAADAADAAARAADAADAANAARDRQAAKLIELMSACK